MKIRIVSPHVAAATVLQARFGPPVAAPVARSASSGLPAERLASFQQDAVHRLRDLLARWHGAVLADSVGLGKTHVAVTLVRERLAGGELVLVCGPAQLRTHWKRKLGRSRGWQWISHTSLSRGVRPSCTDGLVVIDEAHALRNPATRRYRTASALAMRADVLLLTATPVNNSVFDFFHLVRLFAADDTFACIGVPSLRSAAERAAAGGDAEGLCRVAEAVVVRRTRAQAEAELRTARAEMPALAFPGQEPLRPVRYDLRGCFSDLDLLLHRIMALTFPVHAATATGARNSGPPAPLMRLALLKRLESSTAALASSLVRYSALLEHAGDAARDGYVLERDDRQNVRSAQLLLKGVALRAWPSLADRSRFIADVVAEKASVHAAQALLRHTCPADPKLAALRRLLDGEVAEERVLVFTEYRDTAVALWRALARRGGVALIHGSDARLGLQRSSRRAIIERFAPLANGVPPPAARECVRVLIATDVLSEGLNLQDARVVVSYDMPWNPVRLAQRIGRIDRLGSPHASVVAFTFVPARELESLLGLMRRVRRKLRAIRTIGGDAPRLRAAAVAGHIERAEELRAAWRSSGSHAVVEPTPHDEVPVARLECAVSGPGVLIAVESGGLPRLLIWSPRPDPRPALAEVTDELLLRALRVRSAGKPDEVVVRRAVRWAVSAVRRRIDGPATVRPGPITAAARLIRRWGRRDDADLDAADRALSYLSSTAAAADPRVRLALAAGDDSARVRALVALAGEAASDPTSRGAAKESGRVPLARVLAAIELVPVAVGVPGS